MKYITVSVSETEITDGITTDEIIKMYGGKGGVLFSNNSVDYLVVVKSLDIDFLLDAIGEDAINDYLNPKRIA